MSTPGGASVNWVESLALCGSMVHNEEEALDAALGLCALMSVQPGACYGALRAAAQMFAAVASLLPDPPPEAVRVQVVRVLQGYKGAMGAGEWGRFRSSLSAEVAGELEKLQPGLF